MKSNATASFFNCSVGTDSLKFSRKDTLPNTKRQFGTLVDCYLQEKSFTDFSSVERSGIIYYFFDWFLAASSCLTTQVEKF